MAKIELRRIVKLLGTNTEIDASVLGFRYRRRVGGAAVNAGERRLERQA